VVEKSCIPYFSRHVSASIGNQTKSIQHGECFQKM
jgi:hypothetical protein